MLASNPQALETHRNQVVAKSFYKELKREGFSHQQIIELSATLIDFVTRDMAAPAEPAAVSK